MTQSPVPAAEVVAHRGELTHHRENTLAAISDAIDAGIRWIECDIQLNADREPVLLHDPSLKRLHNIDESVFNSRQPLDSLAQLLALLDQHPEVTALLEVKFDSIEHWGINQVLESLLPMLQGPRQRHYVITTSIAFLQAVRARHHHRIGCILRDRRQRTLAEVTALAPQLLIINQRRIGEEPLWPGPWRWAVYEIENLAQARHWQGRGVHYMISFYGRQLLQDLVATPP